MNKTALESAIDYCNTYIKLEKNTKGYALLKKDYVEVFKTIKSLLEQVDK